MRTEKRGSLSEFISAVKYNASLYGAPQVWAEGRIVVCAFSTKHGPKRGMLTLLAANHAEKVVKEIKELFKMNNEAHQGKN